MNCVRMVVQTFCLSVLLVGCASTAVDKPNIPADGGVARSPQETFEQFSSTGRPDPIEEFLVKRKVPGVSVAVIRNFEIAWSQGYGTADVESGAAVTPDTLFQAASISKPVAAMAAIRAVQDGKFGLDDNINSLLTSWQLPENALTKERPVTPRMLLSHTGGTTVHGFGGYSPSASIPTVPQLLSGEKPSNSGAVFVDIPPGTKWRYSGGGTTIMQLAMTDLYEKPFPAIVKELVLDPLGMTNSGYDQPLPPDRDRIAARAHNGRGAAMDDKWHVYPELQAAGLWTTPADLCHFALGVMNAYRGESSSVLTQENAELMVTPVEPGDYGLGLSVSKSPDATRAGHGGSNWGFRCQLEFNLDSGNGLCIMTNGDAGQVVVNELKRRLATAYDW